MVIGQICIIIGGILSLLMAIFHTRFYQRFEWGPEFEKISPRNQKIFYTIHIALLLLFFVFAALSLIYSRELGGGEGLAFGITGLYALFWLWRGLWQLVYFNPSKIKRIRKLVFLHYFVTLWFFLLFAAYVIPVIIKLL